MPDESQNETTLKYSTELEYDSVQKSWLHVNWGLFTPKVAKNHPSTLHVFYELDCMMKFSEY